MISLTEQVNNYLNYCAFQKRLDAKSIKAYKIDLSQLTDFLEQQSYFPNKEEIEKFITWLHEKYKPKTVKRKLACIKTFFGFLEYEEIIQNNPFSKIKVKFREPFILPKIIPLDTIQKVLDVAYHEFQDASKTSHDRNMILRDIAVMELLFAIGARISEVCSLRKGDVDLKSGTVKIYGKGSKERIIQIGNPDVLKIIIQYSKNFDSLNEKSNYFFVNRFYSRLSEQSARVIITKYVEKSGLSTHITPHMFRHTFATLLLEEDVDIRYIQKFLGHSSIVTTQIYTHVTSQKQKQILVAKHPRNKLCFNSG